MEDYPCFNSVEYLPAKIFGDSVRLPENRDIVEALCFAITYSDPDIYSDISVWFANRKIMDWSEHFYRISEAIKRQCEKAYGSV